MYVSFEHKREVIIAQPIKDQTITFISFFRLREYI